MKKYLILLIVIVGFLCIIEIFLHSYDIVPYNENYDQISFYTSLGDKIVSNDRSTIIEIIKIINTTNKKRNFYIEKTMHSPDCIITFFKEKKEEKLFIYGDKILFEKKQYKIYDYYEFYEKLYQIMR